MTGEELTKALEETSLFLLNLEEVCTGLLVASGLIFRLKMAC